MKRTSDSKSGDLIESESSSGITLSDIVAAFNKIKTPDAPGVTIWELVLETGLGHKAVTTRIKKLVKSGEWEHKGKKRVEAINKTVYLADCYGPKS